MTSRQGVWSWQQAVQESSLPPLAKLVCLNLSLRMNALGQTAYPSIERQCVETGLSNRVVIRYLRIAAEAGYLEIVKQHRPGKYALNRYVPRFPPETSLATCPATPLAPVGEEGEGDYAPCDYEDGPSDFEALPSDFRDNFRVTERHTNYQENYPERTIHKRTIQGKDRDFKGEGTLFDEGRTDLEAWLEERGYAPSLWLTRSADSLSRNPNPNPFPAIGTAA